VRKAEAENKKFLITNIMPDWSPLIMPIAPEVIKEFFERELDISQRRNLQQHELVQLGILFKTGPEALAMRGIFSPIFEYKNIQTMSAPIQDIVRRRVASFLPDSIKTKDLNMIPLLGPIFLDVLDQILFGDEKLREEQLSKQIIELLTSVIHNEFALPNVLTKGLVNKYGLTGEARRIIATNEKLYKRVKQVFQEREAAKSVDTTFLGQMVAHNVNNPNSKISTADIVGNTFLLNFGTYDTCLLPTIWLFHFLSQKPEVQAHLRDSLNKIDLKTEEDFKKMDEEPVLEAFISEVLRLGNPFMFSQFRDIIRPCILGGLKLRKGDYISLPTGLCSFKEDFKDPFTFDENRFAEGVKKEFNRMHYLPFSHGKRSCIGRFVGKLLLKAIAMETLQIYRLDSDPTFKNFIGEYPYNTLKNCTIRLTRI